MLDLLITLVLGSIAFATLVFLLSVAIMRIPDHEIDNSDDDYDQWRKRHGLKRR